jgi:hypothetical protein
MVMYMKNKSIEFKINYKKAIEVILYILNKNKKKGVNMYNLVKIIFAADKYHLNQYARPVTGDCYIKMQYGTVPSTILDYLKFDDLALSFIGEKEYPFSKKKHNFYPKRECEKNLLSESDIEAIEHGIKEYHGLSFDKVKDKNHDEKCWVDTGLNNVIPFELMIENKDIRKYLEENSSKMVI